VQRVVGPNGYETWRRKLGGLARPRAGVQSSWQVLVIVVVVGVVGFVFVVVVLLGAVVGVFVAVVVVVEVVVVAAVVVVSLRWVEARKSKTRKG